MLNLSLWCIWAWFWSPDSADGLTSTYLNACKHRQGDRIVDHHLILILSNLLLVEDRLHCCGLGDTPVQDGFRLALPRVPGMV